MANEDIVVYTRPSLHHPKMVAAFAGWADVTQAGTSAIFYLLRKLKAKEFANITAEEFYDFPANRPVATISQGVVQSVRLPSSNFYYAKGKTGEHDIVLLLGIEPNLKWQRYINSMLDFADSWGVDQIYLVGGLYDAVTHTMEAKITGVASQEHLTQLLREHHIETLDYQGPSSIYTLILAKCKERGVEAINLWGHVPFYIQAESNPLTCLALLTKLTELLEIGLELHDIKTAASLFSNKLDQLMARNAKLSQYIRTLEKQYQIRGRASMKDFESTDKIIKEVEDFLKEEHDENTPF